MATSAPVFTTEQSIQQLYLAYFGRPADAGGLAYWENAVANQGVSLAAVSADFAAQPEYKATYANMSNDQIINTIYHNLFNRAPDQAGLSYWSGHLTAGDLTINTIVNNIAASALQDPAQGPDSIAVESKVAASVAFTAYLNTDVNARIAYSTGQDNGLAAAYLQGVTDAASLQAAETALPTTTAAAIIAGGQPAPTAYTLTTGVDTVTATGINANAFYATLDNHGGIADATATLGGADTITGTGSNNTLILTSADAAGTDTIALGATISDIQVVKLNTAGNAGSGGTAFDVSNISGLNSVTVTSAGTAGDFIKAAATTAITDVVNNGDVNTTGGAAVTVATSAGTINIGNYGADTGGASGAVNATYTGTGGNSINVVGKAAVTATSASGAINVAGGTVVTANASTAIAQATVKADAKANTAALHAVTHAQTADAHAATLVTNLTSLETSVAAAVDQATVNSLTLSAYESLEITQAQKIAIDAAFATGLASSTTPATAQAAAQAAALAIEKPILAAAVAAEVTTAAAIVTAQTAQAATAKVVNADVAATNAASNVSLTDTTNTALSAVTINGAGGFNSITDTHSTLTSVTLNNVAGGTFAGDALVNITETGGAASILLINHTVGHADTLTLSAVTSGGSFADAAAATLNVVSNGTAVNAITLDAADVTALNLSGTAGLNVTTGIFDSHVVITGTNGNDTVALSAGTQSFLGGSTGGNTITASTDLQTVTVDGGTGAGNTLVLQSENTVDSAAAAAKFLHFSTLELADGVGFDVSTLTGSTITSLVLDGSSALTGLTAAQAGAITVTADSTLSIGITGATTPGQTDTVHLTADAGDGGAGTIHLTAPTLTGVEVLHLTANDNVFINTLQNSTFLNSVIVDGAGDVSITTGALALNANTVIDAHASTASDFVYIDASAALNGTNGIQLIGSLTAANTLISNGYSSVLTGGDGGDLLKVNDGGSFVGTHTTFTSGNGNNSIIDYNDNDGVAALGVDTVKVGDGDSFIHIGAGTVTAGNGYNNIIIDNATTVNANAVTVGTGYNTISLGDNAAMGDGDLTSTAGTNAATYTVTLGAHSAAAGVVDTINLSDNGTLALDTVSTVVHGASIGDIFNTTDTNTLTVNTLTATQLSSLAHDNTLTQAIHDASAMATTAHGVESFVYAGNTYVIQNVASGAETSLDTVIELVGVHTITAGASHGFVVAS